MSVQGAPSLSSVLLFIWQNLPLPHFFFFFPQQWFLPGLLESNSYLESFLVSDDNFHCHNGGPFWDYMLDIYIFPQKDAEFFCYWHIFSSDHCNSFSSFILSIIFFIKCSLIIDNNMSLTMTATYCLLKLAFS